MTTIKTLTSPAGTYGCAVEPWSKGEIYAVAADWAQASAPVYYWSREDGWFTRQYQAADFRHSPEAALRADIVEAIATSEGIPSDDVDEDEVEDIVSDAVRIDDGTDHAE